MLWTAQFEVSNIIKDIAINARPFQAFDDLYDNYGVSQGHFLAFSSAPSGELGNDSRKFGHNLRLINSITNFLWIVHKVFLKIKPIRARLFIQMILQIFWQIV